MLGVNTKLVVDALGVDIQLVAEIAGYCQFTNHHAQLCPVLSLGQR